MNIRDILEKIDVKSSYITTLGEKRRILSLCHDSRQATPHCLFFCKSGIFTLFYGIFRTAIFNGSVCGTFTHNNP